MTIMEHITINSDRSVTVPVELRKIGVQYDHNVNVLSFICPRYSGNVDLSTMSIYINYILSDKTPGKYKAKNVIVDELDDSLIHFDWTITRNVTQVSGVLSCLVCAKKTDEEGNEVNHWNTEIFRLLSVSEGMENDQVIQEQYPDVITSLFQKIEETDTKLLEFSGLSAIVSDLEDSVDELKEDLVDAKSNLDELKNEVFSISEQREEKALTFTPDGWYNGNNGNFSSTSEYSTAKVEVESGEVYEVNGRTNWYVSPYCVTSQDGTMLYSGQVSGSRDYVDKSETIKIPTNGKYIVFCAESSNDTWKSNCKCVKVIEDKTSNIADLSNEVSNMKSAVYEVRENTESIAHNWQDGFGYYSNGKKLVDAGYSCSEILINAGDIYKFRYYSQYTLTYVILDADGTLLACGNTSGSGSWQTFEADITAPTNAYKLCITIAKGSTNQKDNAYLYHTFSEKVNITDYVKVELQKQNVLYGKKWVACGESFTAGVWDTGSEDATFEEGKYTGQRKTYPLYIALRNNMEVINEAIAGSTMALPNDSADTNPFSETRYTEIASDADYITLWFGINDANHCTLGTIDDTTNNTFYGAWNVVLEYLIENHPNAKIGIIVTNLSTVSFRNATREVARKWGIPYLDMNGDYQIPPIVDGREEDMGMCARAIELRNNYFRISSENSHPTPNAHRYESTFIEAFLRRL